MTDSARRDHPLFRLADEDLNMILEFVLVSGSIKALAERYSVSYPTMRQRLDLLIERVRQVSRPEPPDELSNLLADLIARGRLAPADARRVREVHRDLLAARRAVENFGPETGSNGPARDMRSDDRSIGRPRRR